MPKLLLADDSVTIQRVIELTFADENIQVIAVGDGQQAIQRIAAERPDVVLADIGMPERDGYEVAAWIKGTAETSHIPVLLLTGAFEPIDEARARAVGCDGVLVKPFEPQMVINRVKDLLAGRRPASLWSGPARPPVPAAQRTGSLTVDAAPGSEATQEPDAAAAPDRPAATPGEDPQSLDSLDEYFDRLDAAFSEAAVSPPAGEPAPAPQESTAPSGADLDAEFGAWDIPFEPAATQRDTSVQEPPGPSPELPARPPASEPAPAGVPTQSVAPNEIPIIAPELSPVAQAPALADAFVALLAAEQKVGPVPVSLAPLPAAAPTPSVDESLLEDIVRRVVARMTEDSVRSTVLDVAERLVREEIERIKQQAKL